MRLKVYKYTVGILALISGLQCTISFAANGSDLTEAEWLTWPDYCKAAFHASDWSRNSRFSTRLSKEWVTQFRKTQWERYGIPGAHHFCVGMTYINRGRSATGGRAVRWFKQAIEEIEYSYSQLRKDSPSYSLVCAYYGAALYGLGEKDKARVKWREGISVQPDRRESYLAMAKELLSENKYSEALELLLEYDNKKTYATPDGEHFLAVAYYELGDYAEALRHANNAFTLGYPTDKLKNKLEKLNAQIQ